MRGRQPAQQTPPEPAAAARPDDTLSGDPASYASEMRRAGDLTSAGSVLGTPAYMAPEQARGEAVDQRADVFAIGAMLWELCSVQKVPLADAGQRHRLLRRAGIDNDLVAIIDKAVDAEPSRRYPDAGALATDLKAFKSGTRITARSYSPFATLAHWTRRHRTLAAMAMAFVALLAISVVTLAVLYRASSSNAEEARRNAETSRRNAETAQQRLTQSYVEQGRRALLDGKYNDALPYLVHAAHSGDHSPSLRFMLERAAQPLAAVSLRLRTGTSRVWSAVFSHDGRRIVTADDEGGRVWDAQSGRLLFILPHADTVSRALYTPDDRRLVTFGNDGLVKIWDGATGALAHTLRRAGPPARYREGAISPDGQWIVAKDDRSGHTHVWNANTQAAIAELSNERGLNGLAFSQDGHWLATTGGDKVHVFDTQTWRLACTPDVAQVSTLAFDPTGPRLLTGTLLGDVAIFEIPSGARMQHLRYGGVGPRKSDSRPMACSSPPGTAMKQRSGERSLENLRFASPILVVSG